MPNDAAANAATGLLRGFLAGLAAVCIASAAHAGGYDTGERDWDFLFQPDDFAVEAGTRYIVPQRELKNVAPATGSTLVGTTASVREAEAFTIARLSAAARLTEQLRCLASFRQPWEGHANYGTSWVAAASATEQHFSSEDFGVTCAASTAIGMGNLLFIGGASYQKISYELVQSFGGFPGTTNVGDDSIGWRAGIGYEIPQYALRATLIYNSAIDYDMVGTAALPGFYTGPVYGSITMPQSVELRAQSGVAPGWLAFGSVKWTDWSVARDMPLCIVGTACTQVSGLTLLWKDTWTVTLGAAHQFNEMFSLAGSLTWDQGGTQGFTSQTDTWVAGLNAIIQPNKNLELNLGGTVGIMTAGSLSTGTLASGATNPVGYTATFGDDLVYALSAAAKLHY